MKRFMYTCLFLFALCSGANAQYNAAPQNLSSPEEKQAYAYYQQGVSSLDRALDSVLYFAERIRLIPSKSPVVRYYYHALKFSYHYKSGFMKDMKKEADECMTWAAETGDDGLIADAYGSMAIYYLDMNTVDSINYYFEQALNKAMLLGDEERIHHFLSNYSNSLIEQGESDLALQYAYNSIAYDSLNNNNLNKAHNYHLLGNIYLYSGDYPKALDALLIARAAYEKENNLVDRINVMNNIGLVYTDLGNIEAAQKTYEDLIDLVDKNHLGKEKISALINLGTVYGLLGDQATNKKLLLEALALSEKDDNLEFDGQIQNNLGNVAYYQGDYAGALTYFQNGLAVSRIERNRQEEAICLTNTGWAFLVLNRKKECFEAFESAYALATEIKSAEKRMMALEGLADASEYFGDYKGALVYKNRFVALKDSVLGEKTRDKIAELEAMYESEKKESEIENLKNIQAEKDLLASQDQLKIANQEKWLYGMTAVLISLLVLGLLIFFIIRASNEKEKSRLLLESKEKSLVAIFEATEKERQRIAKDLHDGIGQQLSGLKLAWSKFAHELQDNNPAMVRQLTDMTLVLDGSATELREISHQMMPRVLSEMGLIPALNDMLEKSLGLSGVDYSFEHYNLDSRLSQRIEIALFRVTQELINNIIKHSGAKKVNVQLFKNQEHVILIVEDDGRGIDSIIISTGHGFMNIKSRLDVVKGTFNLEPSFSSGTVATIRVSLQ